MNGSFITVVGNLTYDPEVRYTQAGKAVCTLSLASNRSWKVGDEWEQETTFYKAECWGEMAEHVGDLEKGNEIIVCGTVELEEWTNDDDETRTNLKIRVDNVGVSLRYQTVGDVKREKREGGSNNGGGSRNKSGGRSRSRNGGSRNSGGGSKGQGRNTRTRNDYSPDEEPF